jgi:hypothetical protein
MGLVAWQPGLVFLVVLKRGGVQHGVICPQCPRAVRRGWVGGTRARRTSHASGARDVGVKGSLPPPWPGPTQARAHRPSACGPPGWCGCPVARARREAARLTRRWGKVEMEEGGCG